MKLVFVSSGQFPHGGASSIRQLAYAKGLAELGHSVDFILLEMQEWNEHQIEDQGIRFICVSARKRGKLTTIEKFQVYFNTIRNAKNEIISLHKKNDISALTLLGTKIAFLIPMMNKAKNLGIKVFHERTEYPFIYGNTTLIRKFDLYIYKKFVIRKFDGIYVISNALKKYFSEITNGKVPITIVNMIVDPSRFEISRKQSESTLKTISYCGNLEFNKDGIPILIEAISLIAEEFPFVRLQLISSSENELVKQNVLSLAQKYGIQNKIKIVGPFKSSEIPRLLIDSEILALSRPNNIQAEGGFPTKLGEYLATGNPVVITNIGEIDRFLTDGVNAFIAEPDSAEKFADKLRGTLLSANAVNIGLEGKKLVYGEFNYLIQAKILEEFLTNTNSKNIHA